MAKELTDEEIAEDVMNNDKDPLEAIREIRREEGVAEEDLPPVESAVLVDILDDKVPDPVDDKDEEIDALKPEADKDDKETDDKDDDKDDDKSDDEKAAAEAATTADAAIETANDAANKAAGVDAEGNKLSADDKSDDDKSDDDADNKDDKSSEDDDKIYKFKANNQDFTFTEKEILEQFETVFGQAMNYTQKMQKIAPYRKMISALEQEGISHDNLNLAIDALKGDKGAIKKLLEIAKVDAYDLTSEDENEKPYIPKEYGKNETQLDIEEITGKIQNDEEFKITTDVIDNQWDDASRTLIANNPNMITGLHNDIKSGVYDTVAPAAMKMKVLDGNTKSDIEYYMLAGEQLRIKMEAKFEAEKGQNKVDDLNKDAQNADSKFDKASSEAVKKRAASSTGKRADRKGVIDYLDDDDEAYDEWYKKTIGSSI